MLTWCFLLLIFGGVAWQSRAAFAERDVLSPESANILKTLVQPNTQKLDNLNQLLTTLPSASSYKLKLEHLATSKPIRPFKNAILTCALSITYTARDATHFVGTARRAGYLGDVVVIVHEKANDNFLQRLHKFNATIFVAKDTTCSGATHNVLCSFMGASDMPVTLLRFFMYQDILHQYSSTSQIIMADFRDVVFQSDPFKYRALTHTARKSNQLFLFQETHPNRVIGRDSQNAYWVSLCYGVAFTRYLSSYTISTSGVVIGSRNAALAYAHLITVQIDPVYRAQIMASMGFSNDTLPDVHSCLRFGVDQGFHNVLLYLGVFERFLDVKLYQQGEGPVNIVGGFFGENKLLRAYLSEWKVLRGEAPFKYVYNWNGEISPIVHQLDRFL